MGRTAAGRMGGTTHYDVLGHVFTLAPAPAAGWSTMCWPTAVQEGGVTYFAYNKGWVGDICINGWDEATQSLIGETVLWAAPFTPDDHDSPCILIRPDGKLQVFVAGHGSGTLLTRVSSSTVASDPDLSGGFDSEVDLDSQLGGDIYTYVSVIKLSSEICLVYRDESGSVAKWALATSSDGDTWNTQTIIFNEDPSGVKRPYMTAMGSGTRIDFIINEDHPDNETDVSSFHFYRESGTYRESNGTSMGSPPFTTSDATLLYDATGQKGSRGLDLAMDGSNIVALFYVVNTISDVQLWWGRWDGSAWDKAQISDDFLFLPVGDGQPAVASLDRDDPHIIYASLQDGTRMEIFKITVDDVGAITETEQLTQNSKDDQFQPFVPLNASSAIRAYWRYGTRPSYLDWMNGARATSR